MSFEFGRRSLDNLIGVHHDLRTIAMRAIALSEVDFAVIEGLRTQERQDQLVLAGASQTSHSKHIIGMAIDTAAYVHGAISWDWIWYPKIAHAFQKASREFGIQIVWGAVWSRQLASLTDDLEEEVRRYVASKNGKAFVDSGHYELRMLDGLRA